MLQSLTIRQPDDFHRHLRQLLLLLTAIRNIGPFARAIVMPNTTPAIATGLDVNNHRAEIMKAAEKLGILFKPLMTIKLLRGTTPEILHEAYQAGAVAVKFYPEGMTTNAEDGMTCDELLERKDLLETLQTIGLPLLCHGEHDGAEFCLDREHRFLKVLERIAAGYPHLRIVMEHITTTAAVEFISQAPITIAATITPHHLRISLNDVIGDKLRPHNFCKPVAKRPADMRALIQAATSGNPNFFLGTDDAPHLRTNKECASGCAGVFTGPHALLHYAEVFEEAGHMNRLENFSSVFGARFYDLPLNKAQVKLVRQPTIIPDEIDGIVPFMAGKTLNWSIVQNP